MWNPFLSRDAKDIYNHLTPDESRRLTGNASESGRKIGLLTAITMFPIIFIGAKLTWGLPASTQIFISFSVLLTAGLLIGYFAGRKFRQRAREILCSTQYAIQKGYTQKTLKLYFFQK
jgi:hypothetical protein